MAMSKSLHDMIILGAGMTGLTLAHNLSNKQSEIILVDKGRGPGGRMATRRFAQAAFDTGAQFIRARSMEFREFLSPFLKQDQLRLWKNDANANPLYWGQPLMTSLPKAMAANLKLYFEQSIEHISCNQEVWSVRSSKGEQWCARQLVITFPIPQCLDLFKHSGLELESGQFEKLQHIRYRKTLALLACLNPETAPLEQWYEYEQHSELERRMNQHTKGVSAKPGSLLFHFNHDFSSKWFEQTDETIMQAMADCLNFKRLGLIEAQIKKWRFADPLETYGELYLKCRPYNNLYLGGDAFGGGSVEGAWRSACALEKHFLAQEPFGS